MGKTNGTIRYLIADFFVKIINDFRHFLALIIVLMFAFTMVYVLVVVEYKTGSPVDEIGKALQAVTGTLSGIIGVILGYYFGESAANRANSESQGIRGQRDAVQGDAGGQDEDATKPVRPAPKPPVQK